MDPQVQQAQLAAILGADPAPFETLISHLMSSSNEQRSQAELIFNLCKQTDPNSLFLKLGHLLQLSPHMEARAMSAILLRKQLTQDDSLVWNRLSPTTQVSLKSILLACVQQEEAKTIMKKLCDTISELASSILPDNGWPELLPFMFQCVSSDSPKLQESAFLIFAQLSQYIGETLIPHIKHLHGVFLQCLTTSGSSDVRIAALSAVINFIQCLSSSGDRDRFQDLLPAMMTTLTEALNGGQEATAQEALELLIELAGTEPRFLRRQLVEVVGSMLQIAEAETLEEGTRHLAIEFVITLAEARERAPGMMRKLPQFISRLFCILLQMLLDVEDEPAWHTAENEDEDAGESSNYSVGQECLDRLAIALGGNTIVPVASEQLPAYLAAPEWQKHHAALIALAQIAEGCSKVMIKNLEQVVSMVLNSFQDPHPRVRWAAINAIGQLATDLGPDLQVQYHQRVLPALANAMDDFNNPRVQAHAASAVLNFSENCTPDILTPYLDGIVSKLLVLLQNGKQMVQEGALTALASVADSSQEHFQKYYDAVMPYLKAILVNANDKANRMLRAKAMECISLVGMAVGKEKFRDDAKQVMEVLMSLQGSQMETDDPTTSYMLQAWARLCKCLGQDFLPYMSVVMPPLLLSAQLKPDVIITSAASDNELDESDDESMETITLGDKRIGIKTSVLEEKATACNMLCCYADELKEGFYPWIDQVAPTLVPLLKFYFHEEVRKAAVSAMPELLRSAKLAIEKGLAQGRNESYIKQLSDYIVPALVEALHKEPDTEICASMLDALNECIQVSGTLLDENQVRSIVDEIKQVITASSSRKTERAERAKAEDFDAEEGELLKEENEQEEEVFDQIGEILGTLIKTFKASFLPFFDEMSSYLMPMWGKDKTAEERRKKSNETSIWIVELSEVHATTRGGHHRGKVVSSRTIQDVQPPMDAVEYAECEAVVKEYFPFQEAMKKRGIEDMDLVMVDAWCVGYHSEADAPSRRLAKPLIFCRTESDSPMENGYARPVEGIYILVDMQNMVVIDFEDRKLVPLPPADPLRNYTPAHTRGGVDRSDVKPLQILQPDGPSFRVNGQYVEWQKWNFRIGFTPREGLVIHSVAYVDGSRGRRPIAHRLSFVEMVVPYGDPNDPHYRKNAFDAGEDGLGKNAHSLKKGCDCLGYIKYFDAHFTNFTGGVETIENCVCMHEEDHGILWKHQDWRTGLAEVRRSRRLTVSFICTVANYEYGFYWHFYQDGKIEAEVKLTGILSLGALQPGEVRKYGTTIAPGLYAPVHQHFFVARMDMAVDCKPGEAYNQVVEVNVKVEESGKDNVHNNAFYTEETLLKTENEAMRDCNQLSARHWIIRNTRTVNRTGQLTGYKLVPGSNCLPLAGSEAKFLRRAEFLKHNLWVTPYALDENFPGGEFPNQNPRVGEGLASWVKQNRSLEETDIVLWYVFGITHVPRLEDWPVMPVEHIGFMLQPHGFFNCSPAVDVPPGACEMDVKDNEAKEGVGVATKSVSNALIAKL